MIDGESVPNEHDDADHDGAVLAGVDEIDVVGQLACNELAAALDPVRRVRAASGRRPRPHAGRASSTGCAASTVDSYHTVWFELHENLLATLGIERGHESGGDQAITLAGGALMARFGSLVTAMVTPFDDEGRVDLEGAAALAAWLVEQGNDGLVLTGSTGEGSVLGDDEQVEVWRAVRAAVDVPLVAGHRHQRHRARGRR